MCVYRFGLLVIALCWLVMLPSQGQAHIVHLSGVSDHRSEVLVTLVQSRRQQQAAKRKHRQLQALRKLQQRNPARPRRQAKPQQLQKLQQRKQWRAQQRRAHARQHKAKRRARQRMERLLHKRNQHRQAAEQRKRKRLQQGVPRDRRAKKRMAAPNRPLMPPALRKHRKQHRLDARKRRQNARGPKGPGINKRHRADQRRRGPNAKRRKTARHPQGKPAPKGARGPNAKRHKHTNRTQEQSNRRKQLKENKQRKKNQPHKLTPAEQKKAKHLRQKIKKAKKQNNRKRAKKLKRRLEAMEGRALGKTKTAKAGSEQNKSKSKQAKIVNAEMGGRTSAFHRRKVKDLRHKLRQAEKNGQNKKAKKLRRAIAKHERQAHNKAKHLRQKIKKAEKQNNHKRAKKLKRRLEAMEGRPSSEGKRAKGRDKQNRPTSKQAEAANSETDGRTAAFHRQKARHLRQKLKDARQKGQPKRVKKLKRSIAAHERQARDKAKQERQQARKEMAAQTPEAKQEKAAAAQTDAPTTAAKEKLKPEPASTQTVKAQPPTKEAPVRSNKETRRTYERPVASAPKLSPREQYDRELDDAKGNVQKVQRQLNDVAEDRDRNTRKAKKKWLDAVKDQTEVAKDYANAYEKGDTKEANRQFEKLQKANEKSQRYLERYNAAKNEDIDPKKAARIQEKLNKAQKRVAELKRRGPPPPESSERGKTSSSASSKYHQGGDGGYSNGTEYGQSDTKYQNSSVGRSDRNGYPHGTELAQSDKKFANSPAGHGSDNGYQHSTKLGQSDTKNHNSSIPSPEKPTEYASRETAPPSRSAENSTNSNSHQPIQGNDGASGDSEASSKPSFLDRFRTPKAEAFYDSEPANNGTTVANNDRPKFSTNFLDGASCVQNKRMCTEQSVAGLNSNLLGSRRVQINARLGDKTYQRDEGATHLGVDIDAKPQDTVYAPISGKIIRNTCKERRYACNSENSYIIIKSKNQEHVLMHVDFGLLKGKDEVVVGDPVGNVISDHVHWGINSGSIESVFDGDRGWGFGRGPKNASEDEIKAKGWIDPTQYFGEYYYTP